MTDRKKKRDPLELVNLISTRHARSVTAQQCTATSKRTGQRCKAWALRGARTCRVHGSATRKARTAAAERIAQASGYAADMLVELMADPAVDLKERTRIAQDLLNRAGLNQQNIAVQLQTDKWDNVLAGVLVDVGDPAEVEGRMAYAPRDEVVLDAEGVEDSAASATEPKTHVQPTPRARAASTKRSRSASDEQAAINDAREKLLRKRLGEDRFQPEYKPNSRRW